MKCANCLYEAYAEKSEVIAKDLGRSFQELDAKARANFEPGRDRMKGLVKKYLNRDYTDPSSPLGVKWDFLKYLDLYHSIELRDHINQNSCTIDC
jgi:Type VI secretion system (T6SS), amidase immunity protein